MPVKDPLPASDPRRQLIIQFAESQLGKVSSNEAEAGMPVGQRKRKGWSYLKNYFDKAAPGLWTNDTIIYLQDGLPSWCGIFALWAMKSSLLDVKNWIKTLGIGSVDGITTVSFPPNKGDVAFIKHKQHHAIVTDVIGNTIYSIDGNSYDEGNYCNGTIQRKQRQKSEYHSYYSATAIAGGITPPPVIFVPTSSPYESPTSSPNTPYEPWNAPTYSPPPAPGGTTYGPIYTVQGGDTLRKIAQKIYGDSEKWNVIYQANKVAIGSDPGKIFPGQVLKIP